MLPKKPSGMMLAMMAVPDNNKIPNSIVINLCINSFFGYLKQKNNMQVAAWAKKDSDLRTLYAG